MQDEYESLIANETWVLIKRPRNNKIVKWIFKTKYEVNGEIRKYKARLVTKVRTQEYSVDMIRPLHML
jgi:hypothetical protein